MVKKAKKLKKSPSSVALGGARAVPYEDFEVDDGKPKRHTRSTPEGATHPGTTSYEILADGCDYQGKVSHLKNWAQIRRLTPTCQVYQDILEYVGNSESNAERFGGYRARKVEIKHIYKVERPGQRSPFPEPVRMMLWHATRPSCIPGILERGLQPPWAGSAVFFADRFAKSQWYATSSSTGSKFFLLAEVTPGNMFKYQPGNFHLRPQGYESIQYRGLYVPDSNYKKTYHGAVMPCGPTVQEKCQNWGTAYNEFLIFDPQRAIVRFIVECR